MRIEIWRRLTKGPQKRERIRRIESFIIKFARGYFNQAHLKPHRHVHSGNRGACFCGRRRSANSENLCASAIQHRAMAPGNTARSITSPNTTTCDSMMRFWTRVPKPESSNTKIPNSIMKKDSFLPYEWESGVRRSESPEYGFGELRNLAVQIRQLRSFFL